MRARRVRPLVAPIAILLAAAVMPVGAATAGAAVPLPGRVFAPYVETWTGQNLAGLAQASGARYLTLAFLKTAAPGSCTPLWNGDPATPISAPAFRTQIATVQGRGGDVIASFGGFSADSTGTELADSCSTVAGVAAGFQNVITSYGITRIDLDVEDKSLTDPAGIDRRNKAIARTQAWAAGQGRTVQFSYTLPTSTTGLDPAGLAVLRNAVANHAVVDLVNLMTFDYFDGAVHEMAADTRSAATGLLHQLQALYPGTPAATLWHRIGVTEMIGVDDFGPAETFTVPNARAVRAWAARQGLGLLSFWALQRDNGSCPGAAARDNCSSIVQTRWRFSQLFAPFTAP
jgi:chitinase